MVKSLRVSLKALLAMILLGAAAHAMAGEDEMLEFPVPKDFRNKGYKIRTADGEDVVVNGKPKVEISPLDALQELVIYDSNYRILAADTNIADLEALEPRTVRLGWGFGEMCGPKAWRELLVAPCGSTIAGIVAWQPGPSGIEFQSINHYSQTMPGLGTRVEHSMSRFQLTGTHEYVPWGTRNRFGFIPNWIHVLMRGGVAVSSHALKYYDTVQEAKFKATGTGLTAGVGIRTRLFRNFYGVINTDATVEQIDFEKLDFNKLLFDTRYHLGVEYVF